MSFYIGVIIIHTLPEEATRPNLMLGYNEEVLGLPESDIVYSPTYKRVHLHDPSKNRSCHLQTKTLELFRCFSGFLLSFVLFLSLVYLSRYIIFFMARCFVWYANVAFFSILMTCSCCYIFKNSFASLKAASNYV